MKTTLEIDPELLAEAMKATGAPTKTAAVRMALTALVEDASHRKLAALRGAFPDLEAPRRRRVSPTSQGPSPRGKRTRR